MNVKVSVYIATSLDGFIARKNGDIDWLSGGEGGEDYGYAEFMSTVDVIVMGRNTYEKVLSFGGWPYQKKVIVLTSQNLPVPADLKEKVETMHRTPLELIDKMQSLDIRQIYLDGGVTIQRFLRAGLVDEMTITTIPVLIGGGLSLFGALDEDVKVELLRSQSFKNGFVQNEYRVLKPQAV
jgi:dihydrofolate reductase